MSNDAQIKGRLRYREIPTFPGMEFPEWYDHAACRDEDPNLFFPYSEDSYLYSVAEKALAICNDGPCPVRELCLEHAINFATHGIWGGKTANQVKELRKERRREQS